MRRLAARRRSSRPGNQTKKQPFTPFTQTAVLNLRMAPGTKAFYTYLSWTDDQLHWLLRSKKQTLNTPQRPSRSVADGSHDQTKRPRGLHINGKETALSTASSLGKNGAATAVRVMKNGRIETLRLCELRDDLFVCVHGILELCRIVHRFTHYSTVHVHCTLLESSVRCLYARMQLPSTMRI